METMYETIMSFPLFKGVSHDQLSRFLMKTNIGFEKYMPEETICQPGDACEEVRIIVSGRAKLSFSTEARTLTISEICGKGRVIGADRLFGLNNRIQCYGKSIDTVSVMHFSKEQYLRALTAERILLLNYLNFLGLCGQRSADSLLSARNGNLCSIFSNWLKTLTDPGAESYEIKATPSTLSTLTNIPVSKIKNELARLSERGILSENGSIITIPDRRQLEESTVII